MGWRLCHTTTLLRLLQEAEARQVARASKHLLAASMGTSHSVAHGGGFPSMFPHAGVLADSGRKQVSDLLLHTLLGDAAKEGTGRLCC